MPVSFVSRIRPRDEFAEFRSVLNEARNLVMNPVDADAMARGLAQGGGREYVEMVRELTTALENTKKELEESNRRYEQLTADLRKRGIRLSGEPSSRRPAAPKPEAASPSDSVPKPVDRASSEWDDWNRRFLSLLD